MRGEIGLLSRNILFDSEDAEGSDTYGGNLKVISVLDVVNIVLPNCNINTHFSFDVFKQ